MTMWDTLASFGNKVIVAMSPLAIPLSSYQLISSGITSYQQDTNFFQQATVDNLKYWTDSAITPITSSSSYSATPQQVNVYSNWSGILFGVLAFMAMNEVMK